MNTNKNKLISGIILLLQGAIVGFGAIMPGISGATLCVAFGMYRPIIEIVSNPRKNFKKHIRILSIFILGGIIGFVGLSGLAGYLMKQNAGLVTCAFIGFIIGTIPELWSDAGRRGRNDLSIISISLGFIFMLALLTLLNSFSSISLEEGLLGYLICGLLWGLSFIVPGLSSSTLIIFLGLYQPMLEGISSFNPSVIIPIGIGILICVLLLSRAINRAYERHYSTLSHIIIGIVAATTIMIFPGLEKSAGAITLQILCIAAGAIVSYVLTKICDSLRQEE